MIIADKIIEERKRNGWSQEELAGMLGVSRQAVSKWESAGTVPDLQRVIQLAELFGVSTDYLLKDDMKPEDKQLLPSQADFDEPMRRVGMEEANAFLDMKERAAATVANGVSLCILSPVILIILAALSDSGLFGIGENLAAGAGCTVLFCLIAAAVYMFITCGIEMRRFEYLEKESFETEYGVTGMVREKKRSREGSFAKQLALGVVLCIVSVIPLVISALAEAPDYVTASLVSVLLMIVALGVNMIIRAATVKSSCDTLLQEGEYSKKEKKISAKTELFAGVYWSVVLAVYLGWSLVSMRWEFTWVVWPVAAVLFAAVQGIVRIFVNGD